MDLVLPSFSDIVEERVKRATSKKGKSGSPPRNRGRWCGRVGRLPAWFSPFPHPQSVGARAPRGALSQTAQPRLGEDVLRPDPLLHQELALGLQRAGGTHAHALTAEHTGGLRHGFVEEGPDGAVEASAAEVDGIGVL